MRGKDTIEHLAGPDAVRLKPTLYVGELGPTAAFTMAREVGDNAVDCALMGTVSSFTLHLDKDGSMWGLDDGPGFPTGNTLATNALDGSKVKMPAFHVATGLLHGGGKLTQDSAYATSRGTHGIGIKCTNFLSLFFRGWSFRGGKWQYISYAKGAMLEFKTSVPAPTDPSTGKPLTKGSLFHWKPDPSVLDGGKSFPASVFATWAESAAYFTPNLKITLSRHDGKRKSWHFPEGPKSFVLAQIEKLGCGLVDERFLSTSSPLADVILAFTDHSDCALQAYTNGLLNTERGVHFTAATKCLFDALSVYRTKRSTFTSVDLRDGLVGMINVKLSCPKFSSQTKERLVDPRADADLVATLAPAFAEFFRKNKALAEKLVQRADKLNELRNKFSASRSVLKSLNAVKKQGLPAKAATSPNCRPEERELMLVEGASAGGSLRLARNPYNQEVLALRGKIRNAGRSLNSKVADPALKSEEVLQILMMLGFDPRNTGDPLAKLRVGKVILLADPDPDGPLAADTPVWLMVPSSPDAMSLYHWGWYTMREAYDLSQAGLPFFAVGMDAEGRAEKVRVAGCEAFLAPAGAVAYTVKVGDSMLRTTSNHKWPVALTKSVNHNVTAYDGSRLNRIDSDPLFGFTTSEHLKNGQHVFVPKHAPRGPCIDRSVERAVSAPLSKVKAQKLSAPETFYCLTTASTNRNFLAGSGSGIFTGNCHINALLLTLFGRYTEDLIRTGKIFVVEAPEFYSQIESGPHKGVVVSGSSVNEVKGKLAKLKIRGATISHLKGWGEGDSSLVKTLVTNPATRRLLRIGISDDGLTVWREIMGDSVLSRKKLLGVE